MKKTISINISGTIFHIEEDGYDKLKSYLSSVQQYFSTYEDSQEIVTDIENRIAEKLLGKLKAADKQAVSLEDVNELIAAMGTVADFEAVEEEEVLVTSGGRNSAFNESAGAGARGFTNPQNPGGTPPPYSTTTQTGPRRLVRDLRRKTLGGVASGLAYYFNVDVVWIRLLFVVLFFALPPFGDGFGASISGFTLLVYIAMWIALPGTTQIEDDKSVKKFFRNPEDKVLGGVASGLAAYFGVDTGVIRLLFVLGIVFFGVGLMAYIILWIISPQANTLTEKMEMQGRPITLSNIEHTIKSGLNINENPAQESTLTRILLFPFRAIATIISGLGSALGPFLNGIVAVIRVLAGVIMLCVAFAFMIASLAALGAAIGIGAGVPFNDGDFPVELFRQDITLPMVVSGFLSVFIPALGLAVLGLMLISRRTMVSTRTALTAAAIWFVSLIILSATVTPLANSFRREATVEETKVLNVAGTTPTFAINDVDWSSHDRPSIELLGYEGTQLQLVQRFESQGRDRADAQANARQIQYAFVTKDSTVRFDNEISLAPNARFRGQELNMELMIPYEKPFRMTADFARFIRNEFGEKEIDRMASSLWKFTRSSGLVCINYPRELNRSYDSEDNDVEDLNSDVQEAIESELGDDFNSLGDQTRQFDVSGFSKVDVSGAFVVRFRKGDRYKVVADGREEDLEDITVKTEGNVLKAFIDRRGLFNWKNRQRVGLTITTPNIEALTMSGASKASLADFGPLNNLDIDMSGACRTVFDGNVKTLTIGLSGASNAVLRGTADRLEADLSGASKIEATGLRVGKASVEASGASNAELGRVESLDSETSGASKVTRQQYE